MPRIGFSHPVEVDNDFWISSEEPLEGFLKWKKIGCVVALTWISPPDSYDLQTNYLYLPAFKEASSQLDSQCDDVMLEVFGQMSLRRPIILFSRNDKILIFITGLFLMKRYSITAEAATTWLLDTIPSWYFGVVEEVKELLKTQEERYYG